MKTQANTGLRRSGKGVASPCKAKSTQRRSWVATAALLCGVSAVSLATSVSLAEALSTEFANALKDGNFNLNFRYRYEYVDQDSIAKSANASTLRSRLVYKSGKFKNTFLTLNMDDLRPIVGDSFNDTRNGKTQYPVVADPKGTDLNLASLTFTGLENATIVLGRQRIIRENARFVGNVGWRQNEQTYDSFSLDYKAAENLEVFYGYIDGVKRIFGPEDGTPTDSFGSRSHLVDASYRVSPALRVVTYAYWLDLRDAAAASNKTFGLRVDGAIEKAQKFSYAAEYALQKDYKKNPNDYDEDYYHFSAGIDWPRVGLKAGYEVLSGSGNAGESFQTPLATLHKFNGRADKFLATPAGGLEDLYLEATAKGPVGKYSLVYHRFGQETGSNDYGTEWDLFGTWPFLNHYSVVAGIAAFESEDGFSSDTTKAWLMLSANF